jgi:hypothetical protein
MDRNNLLIATGAGTLLQVLMVVVGHWVEPVRGMYLWGGLAISAAAGVAYAWRARPGWTWTLLGGLVSGGVCALLGILLSFLLGDVPAMILLVGTLSSAVTGMIGGAIGRLIR